MSAVEPLRFEHTDTFVRIQFVPLRVRVGRLEVYVVPTDDGWTLPTLAPAPQADLQSEAERLGLSALGLPGTPVQFGAVGAPATGLSVVFTYLVSPPEIGEAVHRGADPQASWWDVRGVRPAPDVESVLTRALARLEYDVEHGMAGFGLVSQEFTVSELRRVHQAVRGVELDPSNFRKRVSRWVVEGLVEELPRMRPTATRPARLYRVAG